MLPADADPASIAVPMAHAVSMPARLWFGGRRSWWCLAGACALMAPSGVTDAAGFIENGSTHQGKNPARAGFFVFCSCGADARPVGPKTVRAGNPALRPALIVTPAPMAATIPAAAPVPAPIAPAAATPTPMPATAPAPVTA